MSLAVIGIDIVMIPLHIINVPQSTGSQVLDWVSRVFWSSDVATSRLFGAFWGNPRNPRLTGSQGTLKLAQNSLENTTRPLSAHPTRAAAFGHRPGGGRQSVLGASRASFEPISGCLVTLSAVDFEGYPKMPNKGDVAIYRAKQLLSK